MKSQKKDSEKITNRDETANNFFQKSSEFYKNLFFKNNKFHDSDSETFPNDELYNICNKNFSTTVPNIGMINPTANCYMIAFLQSMLSLPEFVDYFTVNTFQEDTQKLCFLFKKLIENYRKSNESISIIDFITPIQK
jgi:hypothetical protein